VVLPRKPAVAYLTGAVANLRRWLQLEKSTAVLAVKRNCCFAVLVAAALFFSKNVNKKLHRAGLYSTSLTLDSKSKTYFKRFRQTCLINLI
jgi:hypothetical protein